MREAQEVGATHPLTEFSPFCNLDSSSSKPHGKLKRSRASKIETRVSPTPILCDYFDSPMEVGREYLVIVTPMKKRDSQGDKRSGEERIFGTQNHITTSHKDKRSLIPPPELAAPLTEIVTPIKKRVEAEGVQHRISLVPNTALAQKNALVMSPKALLIGRRYGVTTSNLIPSEQEQFKDVMEDWIGQEETNGNEQVYTKDKMTSLLKNIDCLVDREKQAKESSNEDRCECATKIKNLEHQIYSGRRPTRKENCSLGVGLHVVLDSQPTPSCPNPKKV